MHIYRNEDAWLELIERRPKQQNKLDQVQPTTSRNLEHEYTIVEAWVDEVHGRDAHKGEKLKQRIVHAMRTLGMYIRVVVRPNVKAAEEQQKQHKRRQHARWLICAKLVCIYKDMQQHMLLQDRAQARIGLVCANTRNVNRLTPKGGVTYDETRRNKPRIKVDDLYTTHRWPRRDKCGPTLARLLQHAWGIT